MIAERRIDLLHLLSGFCDGELSDEEFARMEKVLAEDSESRRVYLEYMELHSGLHLRSRTRLTPRPAPVELATTTPRLDRPGELSASRFSFKRTLHYLTVAGIALAASFLVQYYMPPPAPPVGDSLAAAPAKSGRSGAAKNAKTDKTVATLRQAVDCTWETPVRVLDEGARLPTGEYRLKSGVATIDFDSGSALIVEGPAIVQIQSDSAASIRAGKAVFRADESAAPFALHTPTSTFEDFDTEFAVVVNPEAEEVHVFEGKVERLANSASKGEKPEEVKAGEARRYDGGAPSKPMPCDPKRFVRTISKPAAAVSHDETLLAYEGFQYRSSHAIASGKANGGFGWAGPWKAGITRAPFDNRPTRLELNVKEGLTRVNAPKAGAGGMFAYAGFSKSWRRLAHPVRLDSDGVYYVSYLFRRDHSVPYPVDSAALLFWSDEDYQTKKNENFWKRLNIGVKRSTLFTSLQRMKVQKPVTVNDGVTYLLVAKIAASQKGPDQIFGRVYAPDEAVDKTEPTTWPMKSGPFRSDLVFDWLQLHINSRTRQSIDEIRLGTTWNSVTNIWNAAK